MPLDPRLPSAHRPTPQDCSAGCLYNVSADPGEHVDLSSALPAVKAAMQARSMMGGEALMRSRPGREGKRSGLPATED